MESALLASTDDVVDFDSEDEALPLESFELALAEELAEDESPGKELPGLSLLQPAKIKLANAKDENSMTRFVFFFINPLFNE
jgi:hypothetical protein